MSPWESRPIPVCRKTCPTGCVMRLANQNLPNNFSSFLSCPGGILRFQGAAAERDAHDLKNRMLCNTLVAFCVVLAASTAHGQYPSEPVSRSKIPDVDQECMECICQASSNCDTTLKCHNSGGGYFCGPYVVTWAYWHDGGRPGNRGRKHDFETCLNNKTCAEETVRGYMRKHGRDCDGDSAVGCGDFARIHKLGYGGCNSAAIQTSDYWEKFQVCYEGAPDYGDDASPEGAEYDYGDGQLNARKPTH